MYWINKMIVLKLNFMVELWVLLPSRVSPLLASAIVSSMWHLVTHILSMYTTPPLVHLARCYLGDTCCTEWTFSSMPALIHIHEAQHILPTHKVTLSTEIAKFLMKGLHAWNQGHRKVSKGGVTIGNNFRGCTVVDFQRLSSSRETTHNLGRAQVATSYWSAVGYYHQMKPSHWLT